jgi:two-component system, LytTR family, sensor histidine kinase AlgZ
MTQRAFYLPDLCSPRAALGVVVIVELTAILLALARTDAAVGFWTDLARTSTFLLWIGLLGASLLCALRPRLERFTVSRGSAIVLLVVCAVVAVVSEAAVLAGRSRLMEATGAATLFPGPKDGFLLRNVLIALVVTGLALRYYYVSHEWRRNVEMQARARVHALQARIRPHFLFNSMNTIAALTRSDPACAEQAVQDLADLFRASLNERRETILLEEELEIARTYQRMEQLRLGTRLEVRWDIDELPPRALVPSLTLQPLLENAIYHGIEPRAQGGTITVSGELAGGQVTIVVRNPATDLEPAREGNRLALANIRERLALLYGSRALVKAGRFDDEYIVTLRFPHIETAARLIA